MATYKWICAGALGLSFAFLLAAAPPQQAPTAPKFNVDPTWPKPLPNKWKMGGVTGTRRRQGR